MALASLETDKTADTPNERRKHQSGAADTTVLVGWGLNAISLRPRGAPNQLEGGWNPLPERTWDVRPDSVSAAPQKRAVARGEVERAIE